MCAAEGQETRAKAVLKAMNALIFFTFMFTCFIGYVYTTGGAIEAFSYEAIGVFIALTGPFAYVVRAYFGDLKNETKSRHQVIDDKPKPESLITKLITAKLSK